MTMLAAEGYCAVQGIRFGAVLERLGFEQVLQFRRLEDVLRGA